MKALMEFENPSSSPSSVTDEQRLLAQTKKVTLQPVNPFLKPEDAPDPIVINETHSNIERDAENTSEESTLIQPSAGVMKQTAHTSRRHVLAIVLIVISIIAGVALGASLFLFTR